MKLSEIITYYSNPEICAELVRVSENREVAVQFNTAFGKRPDMLQFPSDITKQVRSGATSFHCSEERWSNPLALSSETEKRDLDKLRSGFDLVLDVDCKVLEWSKVCTKLLMKALSWHNISSASIKFSGGSGFHIAVPWESFPSDERIAFPDAPRAIAAYLKEFIRNQLTDGILEKENDLRKISAIVKKPSKNLVKNGTFDPYSVLDIDTVLIASRHLFRMPYSLNEKKWLVSLPIRAKDIDSFTEELARPSNVKKVDVKFLDTYSAVMGEASQLLTQAFDWQLRTEDKSQQAKGEIVEYENKVPIEAFPPCMKLILSGLSDGRKRSLFALINFLRTAKWVWPEIEAFIYAWNNKNNPPLKLGYVKSQLSWHNRHPEARPPPNCRSFYENFGVCKPDFICSRIRNPITYPKHKLVKKVNKFSKSRGQ
jgi:hypothetical protein